MGVIWLEMEAWLYLGLVGLLPGHYTEESGLGES